MKKAIFLTVMLLAVLTVRADDLAKYRQFADTVRADVYSMDIPAFALKEVPDAYKNESAVIKALYQELDAKKKTGFGRMAGTLRFTRKARVEGGQLTRMLIHINDKAALEKYSEFDFDTDKKKKYWNAHEKHRHVMGVRLVKPDGRIVDIDTSDFIEVEEGKKGEKKSRKLAVPGLEIGDDVDVFFYTESRLQNVHLDPLEFFLKDEVPIINYQLHAVVDDNLTTQYRTLNGAPDFKVTRDDDKNYVLDIEVTDITSKEPRLWYNASQQSPMVKMHIFNRRSDEYTPPSARKDGLQANPDVRTIKEDRWGWYWSNPLCGDNLIKSSIKNGGKIAKQIKENIKSGVMTEVDVADWLYNLLCYIYVSGNKGLNPEDFSAQFQLYQNNRKLKDHELGLSTFDNMEPLDQLINYADAYWFTQVGKENPRYYFAPRAILAPTEIHPGYQGRKAQLKRSDKERKKDKAADSVYITIPMSTPADNRNVTSLSASVDGSAVRIDRRESYLGATKLNAQGLMSEEDINEGYKAYLNRYGFSIEPKEGKKEAADREERYADGRLQQKDDFKDEIASYHGYAPLEFISGRVTSIGIDPAAPEYTYEVAYTMDNLVKRAGKNIILSAGKLLSGQVELLPSDRERTDDVYLRTPREYVTKINFAVPEGYAVNQRSLHALEASVENEAGAFIVTASAPDAATVSLEVTKRYNSPRLPAALWPELVKVLDAAMTWQSSTLLIEKK